MKSTHWLFSLSLLLLACSGSGDSTILPPPGESTGGQAGSAGSSSSAGGNASAGEGGNPFGGSGNESGAAGESGTGGAPLDAQGLCEGACGRIPSCTNPSFNVDLEKCQKKCVEEVTGAGLLIQEIALQFYTGMRDDPKGCSYPRGGIHSAYWAKFVNPDPKVFEDLKEPQIFTECIDSLWKCYDGDKNEYFPSCFRDQYRYNTEIRAKKSACLKLKCPDNYYCWSGASINGMFWQDGIELITQ